MIAIQQAINIAEQETLKIRTKKRADFSPEEEEIIVEQRSRISRLKDIRDKKIEAKEEAW